MMRSPLGPAALEVLGAVGGDAVGSGPAASRKAALWRCWSGGFEAAVRRVTSEIAGFCREGGRAEILPVRGQRWALGGRSAVWPTRRNRADRCSKVSVPPSRSVDALARLRSAH